MEDQGNQWLSLNESIPGVYPDKSHHSNEIEKKIPVWDSAGENDFGALLRKEIQLVFVCFINRSGSNYLLDLLEQLPVGAKPTEEAFNFDQVLHVCEKHNLTSFASYFSRIVLASQRSGYYFVKIGGEQLFWLTRHGFLSRLMKTSRPPKFIYIHRSDKIAQAVSLYIAETTNRYSQFRNEESSAIPPEQIEYDAAKILSKMRYVVYQETLFGLYFALHQVKCLDLTYEVLENAPLAALMEVLKYIDAPEEIRNSVLDIKSDGKTIARQRNELNADFIRRFSNYFQL